MQVSDTLVAQLVSRSVQQSEDRPIICCNKGCLHALVCQNPNWIEETRAQLRGEDRPVHGLGEGSGRRAASGMW